MKKNNAAIFFIVLYFILRTYGIAELVPTLWVIPLLFISIMSMYVLLCQKQKVNYFLLTESRWIIISLIVLLIYKFYEYGNFKLDTTFTYLLGSIPFYILGFSNGLKANDAFIKKIIVSYLWVLFIYLLPKIFLVLSSGYFSSDFFISSFVNGGFETSIIFFLPFIAFVTVYGFKLMYDSKLGYVKIMALIILFFNILALFLSSKAGPISMLLFSFVIYYFKRNNKIVKKYGYLLVVSTIIFLFVFGLSSGLFGDLGTLKSKSTAFVNFIESGFILNNEVLDNLTSQRWTADTYSLFQFFNKPLFGNGAYLESVSGMLGESSNFTTASGGHSFVFDTMAYYGVFGLPIIFILFKFSKDGFRYYEIIKNYRFENSKVLLYSSLMSSVFILNILNTGFLFSTFDNFLFLLSGFYLGKLYFKTKLN
jgi:hypothetical protein